MYVNLMKTSMIILMLILLPAAASAQIQARADTVEVYGGPGSLLGKFETEDGLPDKQGWVCLDETEGVGAFGQLWTGLDDVDPDQDNHSPQWAFLDDGEIVPGTGGTTCTGDPFCYGPDQLCINVTGGLLGDPYVFNNSLLSPPIALPEMADPILILSYDIYMHLAFEFDVLLGLGLMTTADPAGETGWELHDHDYVYYYPDTGYARSAKQFTDEHFVPGARWARLKIYVFQLPGGWEPVVPTPAPYIDNIRLQAVDYPVAPVPDLGAKGLQVTCYPNPFNPTVSIDWTLARDSNVQIRIYDTSGRLVCTLHDGFATAGTGRVNWHGRDDHGQTVAGGTYFCQINAGELRATRKLMLVK